MDPQWLNATVAEIVGSLEALYSATLNESLAIQHLSQLLMPAASTLNLSLSENQAYWTGLLLRLYQQQR